MNFHTCFGRADRTLSLSEEIFLGRQVGILCALLRNTDLVGTLAGSVLPQSIDVPIVYCPFLTPGHVAALVSMDIAIAACTVGVVVHVLSRRGLLLGEVEVA